jgi:YVTN family beta-propeller protein
MTPTRRKIRFLKVAVCLALGAALAPIYFYEDATPVEAQAVRFAGPTSSQPIALSADGSLLAMANPDNDSVTLFSTNPGGSELTRLAEVRVGDEPNGVAVFPTGGRVYVANTGSGNVSLINAVTRQEATRITVGTEPYGLALTPNGRKLYCTNARSNDVSVIDTSMNRVITTISNVGFEPRGIAITNDGDADDNDETVYVTQFLALPRAVGKLDGEDDSKVGLATVISTATDSIIGTAVLQPLADTGFKAAGDAINRMAPANPPQFTFTTGAYPNQLNNIGIKGNFAYLPNTGASPNGPVRFNVNTQSLLSVINRNTNQDAGRTINMHLAVARQANPAKLFITQPWAIAFKNRVNEGFVVSAASNIVVKLAVDPNTGAPTVQNDPSDPTRVLQIKVGKNPRGIAINANDTRAYIMNEVSRDVYVIDLTRVPEQVIATARSVNLPPPGSLEDIILVGKELYNTSVGEFDPPAGLGRMSSEGWGACSTCHPFGLSDNVVWIFGPGPRRTIPQHTDFDQTDPQRRTQRLLNWSAERDEEEDFELNIRGVSGGRGLIVLEDGTTPDPMVFNFTPLASGGRRQVRVRGINAWDAIETFQKFGIRPPISPVRKDDPDVIEGERLFRANNCQSCHGGPQWTTAILRFTPPPGAGVVNATGEVADVLRKVGTFDPTVKNEVRQNAGAPLGANGFAPASLLSLFAFPKTFFHNGSSDSLDAVLLNVEHRSAGTGGVDLLDDPAARQKLIKFILSIDARTPPI